MSTKPTLHLLTRDPLNEPSGSLVVAAFATEAPELAPHRWGRLAPDRVWTATDSSDMWAPPSDPTSKWLVWTGSGAGHPETLIGRRTPRDVHSSIDVDVDPEVADQQHLTTLLRSLATTLSADYGVIHQVGPCDADRPLSPAVALAADNDGFRLTLHVNQLRRYLPELWWANIFGPPLVELIGRDRLAGAPAEITIPLTDDIWYLQVSADVHDSVKHPERFETARTRIKTHLGRDLWWDRSHPEAATRYWKAGEQPGPPRYRAATFPEPESPRRQRRAS